MFKRKSILYRYLASFVSVAIICCVVVGVVGYMTASKELRSSATQEQQKRLMLAVEDLATQFDHLEELSLHVMSAAYYSPAYFSRNPWYEIELLDDLATLSNSSSMFTHCFVRYQNEKYIYTTLGKSTLDAFFHLPLNENDKQVLPALLDQLAEPSFYPLPNGTLLNFPLRYTATTRYSGRATISFYVPNDALLKRVQLVSGENFDRMAIQYTDYFVLECKEIVSPAAYTYGAFTLVFDQKEIEADFNRHFTSVSLALFLVAAFPSCALAAWVAVRNYRPIGQLARRHNVKIGMNELEHLDKTLIDMEGKMILSNEQLNVRMEQMIKLHDELQHIFAKQLIQGNVDDNMLNRMREAGIQLPGDTFYVFVLRLQKDNCAEILANTLQELSDNETAFYWAALDATNSYAVVVNTNNNDELKQLLLESCHDAQVFGGSTTDLINEIPSLLFAALTEENPISVQPSDIARYGEEGYLQDFRKALEEGDEILAIESLNKYYSAYANYNDAIKKLIHNNIISTLLSVSYEESINVPHDLLHDMDKSLLLIDGWVSAICNRSDNSSGTFAAQVINYIEEHMLDFDLSLQSVAEHFSRSSRQIARIVKSETDKRYLEFVVQLRMEHAKELLHSGMRVKDVCEAVCYSSQSHFIKTFTQYTGITPASYSKQKKKQTAEK